MLYAEKRYIYVNTKALSCVCKMYITHIHVIKTCPWIFQWNTAILNYFMSCGTKELIKSKVSMIFFQKNYTHLLEREREREGQREEV